MHDSTLRHNSNYNKTIQQLLQVQQKPHPPEVLHVLQAPDTLQVLHPLHPLKVLHPLQVPHPLKVLHPPQVLYKPQLQQKLAVWQQLQGQRIPYLFSGLFGFLWQVIVSVVCLWYTTEKNCHNTWKGNLKIWKWWLARKMAVMWMVF